VNASETTVPSSLQAAVQGRGLHPFQQGALSPHSCLLSSDGETPPLVFLEIKKMYSLKKELAYCQNDVWEYLSCLETLTTAAEKSQTLTEALEIAEEFLPYSPAGHVIWAVMHHPASTEKQKARARALLKKRSQKWKN
jgi:hypothetical protein